MWSSEALRHLGRALTTAAVLAVVVVLGQLPLGRAGDHAVLRLSLRTTRTAVEVCRERTEAELAELPAHMRRPRVCDAHRPAFELRVAVDGGEVLRRVLRGGGVRGDRPLIVDERLPVRPGPRRLDVTLAPLPDAGAAPELRTAVAELPTLELHETVTFAADRIALVLADETADRLVLYEPPGSE